MRPLLLLLSVLLSVSGNTQNIIQRIDSIVSAYEALNRNAVVIVGDKSGIRYQRTIGYSNIEARRKMKTTNVFKTESAGKLFTGVRIMQLIKEGKLDLQQTLAYYLPEWKLQNADKITLHHMLNHSSGLTSPWEHPDFDFAKEYDDVQMKTLIESCSLAFTTPGERRYYSNNAYILLGKIIEKTDGMLFEESMRKHIFEPAGMKNTQPLNAFSLPENCALPYYQITANTFVRDTTPYTPSRNMGAGGWMSTAEDLFLFAKAYVNEIYYPAEWIEKQITQNGTIEKSKSGFRYGMTRLETTFKEPYIYGHNGGGKGFTVDVFFEPATGSIVVMCANQYGVAYDLTANLFSAILNKPLHSKPQHSTPVKLTDAIVTRGAEALLTDTAAFFRSIGIGKPSERLLSTVIDNLTSIGDLKSATALAMTARSYYPQQIDFVFRLGDMAVALKDREQARNHYTTAKQMAEEQKTEYFIKKAAEALTRLDTER